VIETSTIVIPGARGGHGNQRGHGGQSGLFNV